MTRLKTKRRQHHRGFTIVELMVVIGLILFLMSISIVALSSALGIARVRATQATIQKIHGLMQQRVEAFNRALDRLNLQPAYNKMAHDLGISSAANPQICQILTRKQIYMLRFPQNFSERNISGTISNYVSASHNQNTESAALLFWILTKSEIYGVAPVDQSEFSSSEFRDTDGDGLMEFVDAWGHPLRFFRWPTHLVRPGSSAPIAPGVAGAATPISLSPVDRTYISVLWSGLPAPPSGIGLDPLSIDPDDPTNAIYRFTANSPQAMLVMQNRFHTPATYHAFLIMSAGPDNNLGLIEPYDYGPNPNQPGPDTSAINLTSSAPALGATPGQGRLAALSSYAAVQNNPINDNLTNRKK